MSSKKSTLLGIWRKMWFAAIILYASYFLFRWINVYVANILGSLSDVLLYQGDKVIDNELIVTLIFAFGFSLIIMPLVDLASNVLVFRQGLKYERNVVQCVFRKKYETIQSWKSSEWLGRISNDSIQYRQMAVVTPTRIAADGTVLLIAIVSLLRIDAVLSIVFVVGLITSVSIHYMYKAKNDQLLKKKRDYQNEKKQHQIEMVRGHALWKSFSCEQSIPKSMDTLYQKYRKHTQNKDFAAAAELDFIPKMIVLSLLIFSLVYGAKQVADGKMRAGDFVELYFLVLQIRPMLESILNNMQILRGYRAQEQRIEELICEDGQECNALVENWKSLHFERVSYTYPNSREGMNERGFNIHHDEIVRIAGENGSGKTTLVKLLCGLFSSKNDKIFADAIPLSEINLPDWRDKIGYMQQFPDLFPGSVKENIRIGNLAVDDTQLDAVIQRVGLTELADRSLNGTKNELSGGEIKKIELARILLRLEQCQLLILDEPYENLDEGGRQLVHYMSSMSDKARILISHSKLNDSAKKQV